MSAYLNTLTSLVSSSTTKYHNLRRTLQSETDGETEDDSHISRVLRNYYNDAGRALPPWLPPDPKRAAQQQQQQYQTQAPQTQPYGYSYSGQQHPPGPQHRATLADLWDSSPRKQQHEQPPQSLRHATTSPNMTFAQPASAGGLQRQESTGGSAQDRLKARLWGQQPSGRASPGSPSGRAQGQQGRWA